MSLDACFSSTKTLQWREETKLSNGQMVIVERLIDLRSAYNGHNMGWTSVHQHVRAVLSPQKQEAVWDGKLGPLSLDVAPDGEIYFVAIAESLEQMHEYSVPPGAYYVAFKFKGNAQWERISMAEVPKDMRPNLFTNAGGYFIGNKHPTNVVVDWATKEENLADPNTGAMYKSWSTK